MNSPYRQRPRLDVMSELLVLLKGRGIGTSFRWCAWKKAVNINRARLLDVKFIETLEAWPPYDRRAADVVVIQFANQRGRDIFCNWFKTNQFEMLDINDLEFPRGMKIRVLKNAIQREDFFAEITQITGVDLYACQGIPPGEARQTLPSFMLKTFKPSVVGPLNSSVVGRQSSSQQIIVDQQTGLLTPPSESSDVSPPAGNNEALPDNISEEDQEEERNKEFTIYSNKSEEDQEEERNREFTIYSDKSMKERRPKYSAEQLAAMEQELEEHLAEFRTDDNDNNVANAENQLPVSNNGNKSAGRVNATEQQDDDEDSDAWDLASSHGSSNSNNNNQNRFETDVTLTASEFNAAGIQNHYEMDVTMTASELNAGGMVWPPQITSSSFEPNDDEDVDDTTSCSDSEVAFGRGINNGGEGGQTPRPMSSTPIPQETVEENNNAVVEEVAIVQPPENIVQPIVQPPNNVAELNNAAPSNGNSAGISGPLPTMKILDVPVDCPMIDLCDKLNWLKSRGLFAGDLKRDGTTVALMFKSCVEANEYCLTVMGDKHQFLHALRLEFGPKIDLKFENFGR